MTIESDNCIVCAEEFSTDELKSVALSAVNVTKFKICTTCLNQTNPQDDYREVRNIVNSYFSLDHLLKK
jgi:hypothetical protein